MPNLLNGNYWDEMETYLANETEYAQYRKLLIQFMNDENYEGDFGEVITRVFGIGDNFFSFNEHNLFDTPMSKVTTIRDAVDILNDIQKELFEKHGGGVPKEEDEKYEYINLWARYIDNEGDIQRITINSAEMLIHFVLEEAFGELIDTLSPFSLDICDETNEVKILYKNQEESNARPYLYSFIHGYYGKIVDYFKENYQYPKGIIIDESSDVHMYTFIDFTNDSSSISTSNFLSDIEEMSVIKGDAFNMFYEIIKEPLKIAVQEITNEYPNILKQYGNVTPIKKNKIYMSISDSDER